MTIAAVILAGGRSMRMGGKDKAFATLAGKPLVSHVLDRLKPQAGRVAINSNAGPGQFATLGVDVIADASSDRPGPLAGILAGMRWAASIGATHVLTAPADTPFIPADLAVKLAAAIRDGASIAVAATAGASHPVVALWAVSLQEELTTFLATDPKRKVSAFAERHGAALVDFPIVALPFGGRLDPFFNINTPDDLARAEEIVRNLPA